MASKKQDAKDFVAKQVNEEADRLEKMIDSELPEACNFDLVAKINISEELPHIAVIAELRQRYVEDGKWQNVSFEEKGSEFFIIVLS